MLDFVIILVMAFTGYAGASPLLIMLGVLGLCIGSFFDKFTLLKQYPLIPFSTKIAMFFVASFVTALCTCIAAYLFGFGVRKIFG